MASMGKKTVQLWGTFHAMRKRREKPETIGKTLRNVKAGSAWRGGGDGIFIEMLKSHELFPCGTEKVEDIFIRG